MLTNLLTWIAITGVIWLLIMGGVALWDLLNWFIETLPMEDEMQDNATHSQPRARMVQTFEGECLAIGVNRATMLAKEYKIVVLVHDCTAVLVFPGDKAEDIAYEWQATRKLQEQLMRCEGRGV